MSTWAAILSAAGAGALTGVGGAVVTGILQRPKARADAVGVLTDAALKQVNELQERTAQAEHEATAARNEAAAARHQVHLLTVEVDKCMRILRAWRAAILAPDATVQSLRELVGRESLNGADHAPARPHGGHIDSA